MAVKTVEGDDKLRYSGTNFIPGAGVRKGLAIQDWTPRFGLSGPLRKGRAWFSDSADVQYIKRLIEELPEGRDRTSSWRLSNLLRAQVNLTPSNILFAGFLLNYYFAPLSGLGVLDPPSTTIDQRSRQWFFDLKDQIYFHHGALLEIGFASNQTFGREIPQGHGLYSLSPDGNQGNYYVDATRKGERNQLLANLFLPAFRLQGSHQVKVGFDLDRLGYWQDIRRTGYENHRLDGSLSSRVLFVGNGLLSKSNYEVSSYVQDTWMVKPKLLVEAGVRQDWDAILGTTTATPRLAAAWAPPGLKNTKLSAGWAVIREATNLRLFVRPLDQSTLTTHFQPDGAASGPSASIFTTDGRKLLTPTYQNLTLGLDQRLPGGVYARFDYLRRRGINGLNYSN